MNCTFPKEQRIKRRKEISFIHRTGKRWRCEYFSVAFNENNNRYDRLAVIVSKKIGSAVFRNRVKRVIREIFRTTDSAGPPFFNILIYPHGIPDFEGKRVREHYEKWRGKLKN